MLHNENLKAELENQNTVEEKPITSIREEIQEKTPKGENSSEEAKEEKPKAKETKKSLPKKKSSAKATKKSKAIKDTIKGQEPSIIEEVVSRREVKWIYPDDCRDTLSRKSWRQKQRNKIYKLERQLNRIQDHNSKEYKETHKELENFKKGVLKPNQAV